jgi:hypothetical protein
MPIKIPIFLHDERDNPSRTSRESGSKNSLSLIQDGIQIANAIRRSSIAFGCGAFSIFRGLNNNIYQEQVSPRPGSIPLVGYTVHVHKIIVAKWMQPAATSAPPHIFALGRK